MLYDRIGIGYATQRRPDPRVHEQLHRHLGGATRLLNVGAGTGSYEVDGRTIAVEPSTAMLDQRGPASAPAARAVAEALPFPDGSFDGALAVFTVHHWTDPAAGLAEVRRVVSGPVVLLSWDQAAFDRFWLVEDYVPEVRRFDTDAPSAAEILDHLGGGEVHPLRIPHDCTDGFFAAYWRRPAAYLDPAVRASISGLARLGDDALAPALSRLSADIEDGTWADRYADLRELDTFDAGYRVIVSPGR